MILFNELLGLPTLENRVSTGTLIQSLIFIGSAIAVLTKKYWKFEGSAESVQKLNTLLDRLDVRQDASEALSIRQQSLLERLTSGQEQARTEHREQIAVMKKEHHERIQRLEDEVFFKPARQNRERNA